MTFQQYFNDAQYQTVYTMARDLILVGGRGFGKGLVQACRMRQVIERMPRSTSAFVSPNAKRALTNTLPSILIHFERWGFKRDVHWVIGKKPPEKLGFEKPLFEPANYENVITFYNGSQIFIISQDRKGTSNSHSFDFIFIDEAKFIDYAQLKDETFPANRGNAMHFGHCALHHGMLITSDMPVTKKGSWFLEYEKHATDDLIKLIHGIMHEIWKIKSKIKQYKDKGKAIPKHWRSKLKCFYRDMEWARANSVQYCEFSSIENLSILGVEFIKKMRRDLPPLTFQTSIMCVRIGVSQDGFYSNLRDSHLYMSVNNEEIDHLGYDFDKLKDPSSLMDGDVDRYEPLHIAFDWNANINWLVCGQPTNSKCQVLKSMFVKFERKIPELVQDFCHYYRFHADKSVVFYYDSTAVGNNYGTHAKDFHEVVVEEFERHGWFVDDIHLGRPMAHMDKHHRINAGFRGQNKLTPYFNEENNEDLLTSIKCAGVYNGKKDKRGEKLAETEEDRLEARTDGSDAFDTLYLGMLGEVADVA